MEAILFSANPTMTDMDDAIRHLADHDELYWSVGFEIKKRFSYPICGFIHIRGGQVEYRATIRDILPFSPAHYEDATLAPMVKPEPWLTEWKHDPSLRKRWKNALVITEIVPFSHDTYSFMKFPEGTRVQRPPQKYIRVFPPGHSPQAGSPLVPAGKKQMAGGPSIAEINLEEFTVQRLESIEPGLRLVERQLSTPAGRLDLLCKDSSGNYVVVELKRTQGTDQVVGQILRYMGWLRERYRTENVRGIVIVAKKDQALSYAVMAVPNIQVKEFKIVIE